MSEKDSIKTLPLSCELIDYSVLHLYASVPDKNEGVIPLSIRPDIKFDFGKREYKAFVLCSYSVERFVFNCGIEGSFRFSQEINKDNLINAWFNACTMIYGIMRGIFSSSVNQAIHKPYFLPSVMMINEISKRINKLLLDQDKKPQERLTEQNSAVDAEKR